jgi:hypothetical protein
VHGLISGATKSSRRIEVSVKTMMKRILLVAALAASMTPALAAPVSNAFADKLASMIATPLFWSALYLAVLHHKCDLNKDRFRYVAAQEILHSEEHLGPMDFDKPNSFDFGFMFKPANKSDLCNAADKLIHIFDARK